MSTSAYSDRFESVLRVGVVELVNALNSEHRTLSFAGGDTNLYAYVQNSPTNRGGDTNLYAYVRNSPTNLRDPLGLSGSPGGVAPLPPSNSKIKPTNKPGPKG